MKIMYLMFSFTVGGTERLVADICNEMQKIGNDVFLYIVNDAYDEGLLETINPNVHIELKKRIANSGSKLKIIREIASFVKANQIEVVHCNSFYAPELLLINNVLNRKTRVFYTVHGMGQYKNLNRIKIMYRNCFCKKIIAISESVKTDIIACGANKNKTEVVYNAINLEKFTPNNTKLFDKDQIVLANVARINVQQKGQDILVRTMAILKQKYNVTCYFAGAADATHNNDLAELKKLAEELGVSENVIFLGNVDDVPVLLSNIDIYVLPSRTEGFGISLIEALAMGKPCVASDLDGPREIIGNNERGRLFAVNDEKDLAEKIELVINEYQTIDFKKNISFVEDNFDIKNMCKKLLKLYA